MNIFNSKKISRRTFTGLLLSGGAVLFAGGSFLKLAWQKSGNPPSKKLPDIDYKKSLFLVHCTLVDVVRGAVLRDQSVIIRQGKIASVSPGLAPGPDCEVIDMGSRYIMPGLIDAHCHTTLPARAAFDPFAFKSALAQMKRNYFQQIAGGVTTVRDMGGFPSYLDTYIDLIEKGAMPGPRVVRGCALMNIHGRYSEIDPSDVSIFERTAQPPAENWRANLSKMLQASRERDMSFIKLNLDSLPGSGASFARGSDEAQLIMKFAHQHGLPVAGHHQRTSGFERGLALGVHSLEHTVCDARLSDRQVMALAGKKTALVPTLVAAQMRACEEAYPEIPREFRTDYIAAALRSRREFFSAQLPGGIASDIHAGNRAALEQYACLKGESCFMHGEILAPPDLYFGMLRHAPANLKRMLDAGVLIGCGTDAGTPFVYHGTLWREMELLSRAGFDNAEVLRCATINNARILGLDAKIGRLAEGAYADVAVLDDNPLERLDACKAPALVMREGIVQHAAVGLARNGNRISFAT